MKKLTTRKMSDAQERDIEAQTGARRTRGSGNQFNSQTDNRHDPDVPFATAYEGKSTLAKSFSISRDMWQKLIDQAGNLIPALPLRFYENELLTVAHDLIVLDLEHYLELRYWAEQGKAVKDAG